MKTTARIGRGDFLKAAGLTGAGLASATLQPRPTAAAPARAAPDNVVIWVNNSDPKVDWSKDVVLAAIEAATNTKIELHFIGANYEAQVDAAIASGKLPDIISYVPHTDQTLIQRWIRDGTVAAYEGAVAAAAPQVLAEYRANSSLDEMKVNGKIYMQPIYWDFGNFPNAGLIHVRKDLLDKYGIAPPDTFDAWFSFVGTAIKHGQKGIAFDAGSGIGSAINAFAGAYGLPMLGWLKTGNSWGYWAVQPGIKQALQLFRKMIAMNLVDSSSWEASPTTSARDRYAAGKASSLIFNGGGHIGRIQNDMNLSHKGYKEWMLPAPTAGAGHRGYTSEPEFWGASFLGNMKNNNPVAAARVINYLVSDAGARLTAIGIRGRDYQEVNGKIVLLPRRVQDGFPGALAGDAGAHPLAYPLVSWVPMKWQNFSLLYGKGDAFAAWYKKMNDNQGRYQIAAHGLLTTSRKWTKFQATGDDLVNRAFLQIVKASSDKQAADLFDQFVTNWLGSGGQAASAEMSGVLSAIYK